MGKMKSTAKFLGIDDDDNNSEGGIGIIKSDMDALSSQPPKVKIIDIFFHERLWIERLFFCIN